MRAPQIILICLIAIELLISARWHGSPRKPTSFWTTAFDWAVMIALLITGGFFKQG